MDEDEISNAKMNQNKPKYPGEKASRRIVKYTSFEDKRYENNLTDNYTSYLGTSPVYQ